MPLVPATHCWVLRCYDTFRLGVAEEVPGDSRPFYPFEIIFQKTDRSRTRSSLRAVCGLKTLAVDLTRLLDIVGAFARQTICVVGDFVLDEFVSGEISRVSREAPVLILRHLRSEAYPGGAANAVNNLAELGARVLPVGVVGDDEGGRKLIEFFRRKRVDVSGIVRARDWVTTTKTRYLAGWTHTTEQQVLRVDTEAAGSFPEKIERAIERNAQRMTPPGGCACSFPTTEWARRRRLWLRKLSAKRLTLDSRYRLLEFRDAGVTAATPNESEVEAAYHARVGTDVAQVRGTGRTRVARSQSRSVDCDARERRTVVVRGRFRSQPRRPASPEAHSHLWIGRARGRYRRRGHGDCRVHAGAGRRRDVSRSSPPRELRGRNRGDEATDRDRDSRGA